ncbi:methyl-accepting chemotaxis protein [Pseudothauera nasutitermitis]|nr:methyl-accepting chemotaxis protein [Pseudothauera nasutitermitis]
MDDFRNWPIATKLGVVQLLVLGMVFSAAVIALVPWLGDKLEQKSLAAIEQANRQAIDMLSVSNQLLESTAQRLGGVLASGYPAGFALDERTSIDVDGRPTPLLRSGETVLNSHFDGVDAFTAVTGAVATVFARDGDDFVRVSTSLRQENGDRAVGTLLGAAHPAHVRLLKGESYTGRAHLFGRDYMTHYQPQLDAAGQVVAVLFIGLDFTAELHTLKERLLGIAFGRSGYLFAVDAGRDRGTLVVHPGEEGSNLLGAVDANGIAFIQEMIERRTGILDYQFANTARGETRPRDKVVAFAHFAPWDWVVAAGTYRDELAEEAAALRDRLILAALGLAALLFGLMSYSVRRWVGRPLSATVAAMQRIAEGDLTVAIEPRGDDEIGRLVGATRTMAARMGEAIADIKTAAHRLVDCAEHLSTTSVQLSARSSQQSGSAAAMAAIIEQMNASISQIADNARTAQNISASSAQVSSTGGEIIGQAAANMTRIADTVREASQAVAQLGEQSQAISAIVYAIKEIADQTNLLALNAAIEAARAGESGRGFSVVADEVRKLAERTSLSTQEIEDMIGRIQSGTTDAVNNMETGVHQVEEGMLCATQAGSSIADIRHGAGQVTRAVADISTALAEQSAASADIARNVEQIAQMADENYQLVQHSAGYAEQLKQLADSLETRVARFTINA